jgi:hypothetical protein
MKRNLVIRCLIAIAVAAVATGSTAHDAFADSRRSKSPVQQQYAPVQQQYAPVQAQRRTPARADNSRMNENSVQNKMGEIQGAQSLATGIRRNTPICLKCLGQ